MSNMLKKPPSVTPERKKEIGKGNLKNDKDYNDNDDDTEVR